MSAIDFSMALRGEPAGFVAGMTWLPVETLEALTFDTAANGPADSLSSIAAALGLDFAVVPAHEPWAADAVRDLHERGIAAIWSVGGVLGRAGGRIGWSEALRLTAAEPGALAALLGEELHDALDEVRSGHSARVDALLVADDLAGATGLLLSPDFALDALLPCYRSLARAAAENGQPAIFHSDGDVRALFGAIQRAGFSAVHLAGLGAGPFEASQIAARATGLRVLGGIEVAALISGARRLGVHAGRMALAHSTIVCDDGGLTTPEEVAAYASALETARETYAAGATSDAEL